MNGLSAPDQQTGESISPENGLCIFDKILVVYMGLFRNVYSYSHSDTYPITANAMLRNKGGTGTKTVTPRYML